MHKKHRAAAALLLLMMMIGAGAVLAQDATGQVCAAVYNDANQNGFQDTMEPLLADVVITLATGDNVAIATYITDGVSEPYCFTGLGGGTYNVSITGGLITPTSPELLTVSLAPGQTIPARVQFGAVVGDPAPAQPSTTAAPVDGDTMLMRVLLSLAGALMAMAFFGGLGMVVYFMRSRRR